MGGCYGSPVTLLHKIFNEYHTYNLDHNEINVNYMVRGLTPSSAPIYSPATYHRRPLVRFGLAYSCQVKLATANGKSAVTDIYKQKVTIWLIALTSRCLHLFCKQSTPSCFRYHVFPPHPFYPGSYFVPFPHRYLFWISHIRSNVLQTNLCLEGHGPPLLRHRMYHTIVSSAAIYGTWLNICTWTAPST